MAIFRREHEEFDTRLRGTITPITDEDIPEELRGLHPRDALLLPADDEYAMASASGFDFPREYLDDDFYRRIKERWEKDRAAGALGTFNLAVVDDSEIVS